MDKPFNVLSTLGARNIAKGERQQEDYYATDPEAVELLLDNEQFSNSILEPMCGGGHIADVLKKHGYVVTACDKYDRGYGIVRDMFDISQWQYDIVSNPPYKGALKYIKHCLEIVPEGAKVAMFLRLLFLEGQERGRWFMENPPKTIYVARGRLLCAKNGDFDKYPNSAMAFAWFIWEKGFRGEPVIRWIN